MDIKTKVANLLELAKTAEYNPNEAKVAFLKARKLMEKYKLTERECVSEAHKTQEVITGQTGIIYTSLTDPWALELSKIIAKNYACASIIFTQKGKKKSEIGFIGLEDDFAVCKAIFLYAWDCVKSEIQRMKKRLKKEGMSGKEIRLRSNAYGNGFCHGLESAFREQNEENQELALVLCPSPEIQKKVASLRTKFIYTEDVSRFKDEANEGYEEGKNFNPSHRLAQEKKGTV